MIAALLLLALAANDYTAETTYRKLAGAYPGIRIASDALPASVTAERNLTYAGRDTGPLQLDLYLPRGAKAPVPAVVLVHGGGWRSGERSNLAPLAVRLAARGYAAATVSYRLSPVARYPAAIHDVKDAVSWLRRRGDIDAARIAVAGGSAGGQIASLVGVTSGGIRAVINIDGLSDFTSEAARFHEDDPAKSPSAAGAWFGGRYAEKPGLWHEASPTFHVSPESPPMLFIGSGEPRFSVGRDEMMQKLKADGVTTESIVFPGTPHSFWLFDPWLAPTVDATVDFLDRVLGVRAAQ
jgi:acetyl esterase/lipase